MQISFVYIWIWRKTFLSGGDDEEEQTETAEDSVSGTEVVKVSINKKQIMIGAVAGAKNCSCVYFPGIPS